MMQSSIKKDQDKINIFDHDGRYVSKIWKTLKILNTYESVLRFSVNQCVKMFTFQRKMHRETKIEKITYLSDQPTRVSYIIKDPNL